MYVTCNRGDTNAVQPGVRAPQSDLSTQALGELLWNGLTVRLDSFQDALCSCGKSLRACPTIADIVQTPDVENKWRLWTLVMPPHGFGDVSFADKHFDSTCFKLNTRVCLSIRRNWLNLFASVMRARYTLTLGGAVAVCFLWVLLNPKVKKRLDASISFWSF